MGHAGFAQFAAGRRAVLGLEQDRDARRPRGRARGGHTRVSRDDRLDRAIGVILEVVAHQVAHLAESAGDPHAVVQRQPAALVFDDGAVIRASLSLEFRNVAALET
jgi:hypothetical protein